KRGRVASKASRAGSQQHRDPHPRPALRFGGIFPLQGEVNNSGRNVMARHLKRGMDATAIKAAEAKVHETVANILADIDARKDTAVRDLSRQFDNWSPPSFKLAPDEIDRAIGQMRKRDLDDIKFAQVQVRNFAQKQKETLRDLEVETLP